MPLVIHPIYPLGGAKTLFSIINYKFTLGVFTSVTNAYYCLHKTILLVILWKVTRNKQNKL